MNFVNESDQSCSRFAVRGATLTRLESDRHAYHKDAATVGRARREHEEE